MDKVPESNILVKFCDGAQVFVRNLFEEILSSYLKYYTINLTEQRSLFALI